MSDSKEFDDETIQLSNGEFAIDSASMLYVIGTEIDYVEEVFGSYLQIKNPTQHPVAAAAKVSQFSILQ
jgi:Fe-S cluster assembly iron-binding protein IscA